MTGSEPTDTQAVDAALALLSLVTGDEWDRAKLLEQSTQLREVAIHTLRKQGLTESDAATFVDSRWDTYAADIPQAEPTPSPSTQTPVEVSATANAEPITGTVPDLSEMQSRLADYQARKADAASQA